MNPESPSAIDDEIRQLKRRIAQYREMISLRKECHDLQMQVSVGTDNASTIGIVLDEVCKAFGIRPDEVARSGRTERVILPRHVVFYVCRQVGMPYPTIASGIRAGMDHGTVLYGCQSLTERMEIAPYVRRQVDEIMERVKQRLHRPDLIPDCVPPANGRSVAPLSDAKNS
jgi:chromosomal replication initiation ATPase DnaA